MDSYPAIYVASVFPVVLLIPRAVNAGSYRLIDANALVVLLHTGLLDLRRCCHFPLLVTYIMYVFFFPLG